MPDTRPLAPILAPSMTRAQVSGVAELLREWAGVDWLEATVDDLREARHHQQLYVAALERERARRLDSTGVIDLNDWREKRR